MQGWVTLGISISALLLSATTAYFANFLEIDDLRVMTSADPSNAFVDPVSALPGKWQVVFINGGTRPIAVVSVDASVGEAPGGSNKQCGYDFIPTDTAGFVVREKEIVRKEIALKPSEEPPKTGEGLVTSNHNLLLPREALGLEGNLCLSVSLATVSKVVTTNINLMHFKVTQNGTLEVDVMASANMQKSPQVIWHSKKLIFQSD